MDPSTGTFISMDSYQGSMYDPVTLHKYLYSNANPVMYTVYDTATEIRNAVLGGGSVIDVVGAMLKGVVVGFMCKTALGIVLKPMMAIFGLGSQVDQIQEAIESGDRGCCRCLDKATG